KHVQHAGAHTAPSFAGSESAALDASAGGRVVQRISTSWPRDARRRPRRTTGRRASNPHRSYHELPARSAPCLPLMEAWLDHALARLDRDNDGLVLATGSLLARIVPDAALHARLLNTLSLLEHLGSRKIIATQQSPAIDQPTLRHVAEE